MHHRTSARASKTQLQKKNATKTTEKQQDIAQHNTDHPTLIKIHSKNKGT